MYLLQPNACTVCAKKYATHMRKSCQRRNRLSACWERESRVEGEACAAEQNGGRRSNSLKSIKRQERKSLDYQTGDTLPFCASLAAPQIYGQKCVRKRNNNNNNKYNNVGCPWVEFSYCFFTFWQDLGYKDCHRANCRERQLQMIYRQIVEFKSETQKERKGNGDDDGNFCSAHKYLFIKLLSLPAKYPDPSRQTLLPALPCLHGLRWLCFASGFCHHSMGLCSRPSSPLPPPAVSLALLIARHSLIFKSDFINWMPFLCKYLISRQRAQYNGNFYLPLFFPHQILFLLIPCHA